MKNKTSVNRVHIAEGRPWKDTLISVIEPRSPYRAWHVATGIAAGEPIIGTLDTDPPSVLARVGIVGPDGDVDEAFGRINTFNRSGLLELCTLNMLADFIVPLGAPTVHHRGSFDGFLATIDAYRRSATEELFGTSSLAAARILLDSGGTCTGCSRQIDLTGEDARDRVHIHTAAYRRSEATRPNQFPADWPAALCDSCHDRMRRDEFTSFLDFRFALNPACPSCSAQRTMSTMYGMTAGPVEEPWIAAMGCCVEPWEWSCAECGHRWA